MSAPASAPASAPLRGALIARGAARLAAAGVPGAERDARLLLRWAAGLDGPALAARSGEPATPGEIARFEQAIAARAGRTPLSHIVGERLFWGRRFRVTADVLDPRPETETLVAHALEGPRAGRILDLGTGSGCLLLTLLAEWPAASGLGTDISDAALAVAAGNARALGVAERTGFCCADWCAGLAGPFDLILANPPYVAEAELAGLAPEVRLHEPRLALAGGPDGLDACRRIAAGAGRLMAPGGRLMLEVGAGQAGRVAAILAGAGLENAAILADLDGRERVVAVPHPEKTA